MSYDPAVSTAVSAHCTVSTLAKMRLQVNTPYGSGRVLELKPNGSVCVVLSWGALLYTKEVSVHTTVDEPSYIN
jgi:hypothetical protein